MWPVDTARRSEGQKPQETVESKQSQSRQESGCEPASESSC